MKDETLLSARWRSPVSLVACGLLLGGTLAVVSGVEDDGGVLLVAAGGLAGLTGLWLLFRVASVAWRTTIRVTRSEVVATPNFGAARHIKHADISSIEVAEGRHILGYVFGYGDVIVRPKGAAHVEIPFVAWPGTFCREARRIIDGHASPMTSAPEESHSTSTPHTPIVVSRADAAELEWHRSFFRSLPRAVPGGGRTPTAPPTDVRLVREWDVSHHVPKRGDGQRYNPPTTLSWSRNGAEIAVATDASGSTRWTIEGERIGGGTLPSAYGDGVRIFVSPDGRFSLLEGETAKNWWVLQDRQGEFRRHYCGKLPTWGHQQRGWWSHPLDRARRFSPWRPRTTQLVVVRSLSRIEVHDVLSLPSTHRALDFPGSPPPLSLEFGQLDGRETWIASFHLHPQGDYVAVTVSDRHDSRVDETTYRILMVHLASGSILSSIPSCAVGMGWSPCGSRYLYSRWHSPRADDWTRELQVWDGREWDSRAMAGTETGEPWVTQRHDYDLNLRRSADCNADGTILLTDRGELRRNADDTESFASVPAFTYAAWSPTDPTLFAAVGGKGGAMTLRLYRIG